MPGNPWLHRPPGLLHLYAPNTRFSEHFPEIAIRSAHITFFEGEVLDLTKLVQNNLGFGRFLDPGGETGQLLIEAAVDASAYGEAAYWSVMAKLLQIVARLHAAKPDPTSGEMLITDPAMDAGHSSETTFRDLTRKYLQHNMDRNVSIGDLARHMNLSKSTLAHKYRKLIGETPMKTLTALRINAVKNLMTKGSSLKFIAAQTGFYDEFHLSKVFKKLTGLAPTAYLKQVSARLPKA